MLFTIITFLVVLTLLVLVHEFGHFITARKAGMRVYEFGMGFPPRLFGVYRDPVTKRFKIVWGKGKSNLSGTGGGDERVEEFPATLYSINWLPIGGFCKIKGESGEGALEKDSFAHHTPGKRLIVLLAGVFMNILLAAVLFAIGFMIGLPADISGGLPSGAELVGKQQILVQHVVSDSAAATAGILLGDAIVTINGEVPSNAAAVSTAVQANGGEVVLLLLDRGGVEVNLSVKPTIIPNEPDQTPRLGLALVDAAIIRYPWYRAIFEGARGAGIGFINIFISFFILIKSLVMGKGMAFAVSGPVGIASMVGETARLGWNYLLQFTATISLSLAAINVLPIPALDGGRALFVIIEKVFRRPVPMKYEQIAHTVGFLLLILLIVLVTWRDIAGLVG